MVRFVKLIVLLFALSAGVRAQELRSDSLMKEWLDDNNVPVVAGNEVKILKSGKAKFSDLFESVRQAKHHIHLEYFNFRNDSIAGALFELLYQKAAEGVKVRALFDAFGNMSNNRPLKNSALRRIRSKGVEIYKYDPIRFPFVNHVFKRDHRKIVVIDGHVAYTGGMNVADYYLNGTPQVGSWRDMHMRIEGPAVDQLQAIFLKIWNKVSRQRVEGAEYFWPGLDAGTSSDREGTELHALAQPADSFALLNAVQHQLDSCHPGIGPLHANVELAIVDREPRVTPKLIRQAYSTSINVANEKIQLINPYFVPTHSIRKSLKKALKRGVDVEIMISSHSDIPFTPDATLYSVYQLMKKGAKVYLYEEGFHHSKIMMVDSTFCTLGSANLNSRSLRYDYEVNAFIFDEEVTGEMMNLFETDKGESTQLTRDLWRGRGLWKRFVGWFAHLFTPVL